MACVDERSLDLRRASDIRKIVDGHEWVLAHFDDFGESGVIARYSLLEVQKRVDEFYPRPGKRKETEILKISRFWRKLL